MQIKNIFSKDKVEKFRISGNKLDFVEELLIEDDIRFIYSCFLPGINEDHAKFELVYITEDIIHLKIKDKYYYVPKDTNERVPQRKVDRLLVEKIRETSYIDIPELLDYQLSKYPNKKKRLRELTSLLSNIGNFIDPSHIELYHKEIIIEENYNACYQWIHSKSIDMDYNQNIVLKLYNQDGVFYWTSSRYNLSKLFGFANNKIFKTTFDKFLKAFQGAKVTSPLSIQWKVIAQKSKMEDYASIFHFLNILKEEGFLWCDFDFKGGNSSKEAEMFYDKIHMCFSKSPKDPDPSSQNLELNRSSIRTYFQNFKNSQSRNKIIEDIILDFIHSVELQSDQDKNKKRMDGEDSSV